MRAVVTWIHEFISAYLTLFVIVCIAAGLLFAPQIAPLSAALPYMLFFMVFVMGTSCTLDSLKSVVAAPKGFLVTLVVVYLCMPVIGYGIGLLFYGPGSSYAVGHFLIAITPVAITSTIWTAISNGNIALSLSVVTFATVLSGFYIPLQMSIFMGQAVFFDSRELMSNLVQTIVIPVLLGLAARHTMGRSVERFRPGLDLTTKEMMLVLLAINGAVVRPYMQSLDADLPWVLVAVVVHTVANFFIAFVISRLLLGRNDRALPTVVYAASMKNNAAGIVIALNHFGPIVALPVVLNMIMQQFWAGVCYRVFRLFSRDSLVSRGSTAARGDASDKRSDG